MPAGMTGGVLLVLLGVSLAAYGIGKAVKPLDRFNHKVAHQVCHVVTLGQKCKAQPKPAKQDEGKH